MSDTCKVCLFHLPTWADDVCQCEESPLYGMETSDEDSCIVFERWERNGKYSEGDQETAGT